MLRVVANARHRVPGRTAQRARGRASKRDVQPKRRAPHRRTPALQLQRCRFVQALARHRAELHPVGQSVEFFGIAAATRKVALG